MKLRVRKEEADQVRKLMATEDVRVFENPVAVREGFLEWLKTAKP
jgi:flavoprotein